MRARQRIMVVYVFLVTFLLLCSDTNADGTIKKVTDPTGNVNLSPFEQWESARECLQNNSTSCPDKYQLTETGWVNVTRADTGDYCKPGGCAEHTRAVLLCIHQVKRDYKFIDKTTVPTLNATITAGCDHGFSGVTLWFSSARRSFQSKSGLVFSVVPALFLVAYFNM